MRRHGPVLFALLVLCAVLVPASGVHAQTAFGDTLFSFNAGQLTPTPDRGLNGITFAEDHLWITGFNPPTYHHQLYKMTADGSQLVAANTLAEGYHAFYDLTSDGEYLWVTDRNHLAQIDPATGQLTGEQIPVDLYPYLVQGVAHDPDEDVFWIIPQRNGQLQVLQKIDRSGQVLASYPNLTSDYTTSLTWDSWSAGGPYLWTFSRYEEGYASFGVMRQFDPGTGSFTGVTVDMINRSPIVQDTPLGLTMTDGVAPGTVSLVALQAGALEVYDGLDWVVAYDGDLTAGQPAAAIAVDPTSIEVSVEQNNTVTVPVTVENLGDVDLTWSAYVEAPDGQAGGPGQPGDVLGALDLGAALGVDTFLARSVTFARGDLWVSGRVFGESPRLYRLNLDGTLVDSYPIGGYGTLGWGSIATDGDHIFGTDTYSIAVWSIDDEAVVDNIVTGSISSQALAYDRDNGRLYLGGGNGAIQVRDRDGNEVRFLVTPHVIDGLAWDDVSPGGPYLWAWVDVSEGAGPGETHCRALRLDPLTGLETGVGFFGTDQSAGADRPEAAVISRDAIEGKLTFIALQQAAESSGEAFIVTYDLDAVLPPAWIDLTGETFGSITPDQSATLLVQLHGTMADTTTAAVIKISSNDPAQPLVEIPVTTAMLRPFLSGTGETMPAAVNLDAAYPNPFNPATAIRFDLPEARSVTLGVYDLSGRLVRTLVAGERLGAGQHEVIWNGRNREGRPVSAGVYLYRLRTGEVEIARLMTLVK